MKKGLFGDNRNIIFFVSHCVKKGDIKICIFGDKYQNIIKCISSKEEK